jgi:hypothetical protein
MNSGERDYSLMCPPGVPESNRWGGPPGPRPTPSSAFVDRSKKPARGPAADQGVCPTGLLAVLICLAGSIASAAPIDGTVTNRTTGKPQPGATVTLYKITQNGPESLESVKSDAAGKFTIQQNPPGPRLLQGAYDGVTYAHMLPPGAPSTGVALDVYNSSRQPGAALVSQHMLFFEPNGGKLTVDEMFVWNNSGKTTFNDPDGGTLRFYAPTDSKSIQVNCTAPGGMPIRSAPRPAGQTDVFKVDCPIKPGETNIEVNYTMPFNSPGTFDGKAFFKGGPTSLIVPEGVQLKGEGLETRTPPPQFKGSIYQTTQAAFKVEIEGSGVLKQPQASESEQGAPQISFVLPKLYAKLPWILTLSFSILALGFVLLYRAGQPVVSVKKSGKKK